MSKTRGLRLRARLGLALGATLALMPTLPAAAAPAPPGLVVTVATPNLTVAPATEGQQISLSLFTNQRDEVVLRDVVLKIDGAALGGAATVAPSSQTGCETEGSVTTCTELRAIHVGPEGYGFRSLVVKPTDGAQVGQHGTFTVTISAAGGVRSTATSKVTVGDEVNLTNVRDVTAASRPGGTVTAALGVRNTGTAPIAGADLMMFHDVAIAHAKRHSNCEYAARVAVCHFNTTLAVGAEYGLAAPLAVHVGADAWAPNQSESEVFWATPADAETWWGGHAPAFTRGTAAPLTLVQTKAGQVTAQGQTDPRPEDNSGALRIDVQGTNQANFVAIGARLQGGAGSIVTARVGVRNDGPASVHFRSGNAVRFIAVDIPNGTKAILVPKDCLPMVGDDPVWEQRGKPGAARYRCDGTHVFLKGEQLIWEFRLRIDNADSAPGKVTTYGIQLSDPDLNPADDVAKILINAPGGGGGGELPNTGTTVLATIASGLLLVVLGGAIFALARGRRARATH